MDIGGALAEARSEAGLTITQVSERTRIRATIIRDIERDDYSACGGDFYARGHIRAIARVVGTDPVPLIEEYDAARMPSSGGPGPGRVDPDADTNPDLLDGDALEFGLPGAIWPGLRQSVAQWAAALRSRLAGPVQPAAADRPVAPAGMTAAEALRPGLPLVLERRRRPGRTGLVALVALAVIGVLVYLLVAGSGSRGRVPAAPRSHASASAAAASASAGTSTSATGGPLAVASAAAFGPGGPATGDDPQDARLAVDGSAATAWHTDWYATAKLGGRRV